MPFNSTDYKIHHNLKPLTIEKKEKYLYDLNNIEYSWTGRIDAFVANTFIYEAIQLIINAIELFEKGYFDCAYYSLRQSIEVSTTIVFLTELPDEKRVERMKSWKNQSDFPMYSQMLRFLSDNKNAYADMKEQMSDYFGSLKEVNKRLNKHVHKQGFKYFYVCRNHPLNQYRDFRKEIKEFEDFVKVSIGAIAVMRLAVDPMPILLMNEEIYFRTNDTMTEPFTEEFVNYYIGSQHIENFKRTQIYISEYNYFIQQEKKLPSVVQVVKDQYIDKTKIREILSQRHLLDEYDLIAVILAGASYKITKVYTLGGLRMYFTNANTIRKKNSWSGLEFKKFKESTQLFNMNYDEAFISVITIKDEVFYVEHNEVFCNDEIKKINDLTKNNCKDIFD